VPDERFVRRVLEETPDEIRHAGDQIAHRRIDAYAEAETTERRVHRLRHAVEQLMLDRRIRQSSRPAAGDRIRDAAHVVGAESRSHLAGVLHEVAHAALVAGVGLRLGLEDRNRPPLGSCRHGFGVPVRTLHEADDERCAKRVTGPVDDAAKIGPRILAVSLDHAPKLRTVGPLRPDPTQELERHVLHVVVLHVEVDGGADGVRAHQDGLQPDARLGEALGSGGRTEQRRQAGGLDGHVDARQSAPGIALEPLVGRPRRRLVHQRREHRADPARSAARVP
jgi:hypothetical protein